MADVLDFLVLSHSDSRHLCGLAKVQREGIIYFQIKKLHKRDKSKIEINVNEFLNMVRFLNYKMTREYLEDNRMLAVKRDRENNTFEITHLSKKKKKYTYDTIVLTSYEIFRLCKHANSMLMNKN